jgi:hypothetical protein
MRRFYENENIFPENVRGDLVKLFDHWINSDFDMLAKSNFQARYMTNTLSDKYFQEHGRVEVPPNYDYENDRPILILLKDAWGIDDKEPTYDKAMEYISNALLVGKTENVGDFIDSLFNIINDNFGLNLVNPKMNRKMNGYPEAPGLVESLPQQNINRIIELNNIDMSIWESIP